MPGSAALSFQFLYICDGVLHWNKPFGYSTFYPTKTFWSKAGGGGMSTHTNLKIESVLNSDYKRRQYKAATAAFIKHHSSIVNFRMSTHPVWEMHCEQVVLMTRTTMHDNSTLNSDRQSRETSTPAMIVSPNMQSKLLLLAVFFIIW